jgi:hypothetical protein
MKTILKVFGIIGIIFLSLILFKFVNIITSVIFFIIGTGLLVYFGFSNTNSTTTPKYTPILKDIPMLEDTPNSNKTIVLIQPTSVYNINNASYCEEKEIAFISFDANQNKFQYINSVLKNENVQYVIYIASNMTIIDFNKDFRRIIQQGGDNDMILCRDENNHTTVNLDVIIFRNSEWTLYKLQQLYWNEKINNLKYEIIMDQIYISNVVYIQDYYDTLKIGLPCLLIGICVYNEHAFNSSISSFICRVEENDLKHDKVSIYPWKEIKGYTELEKNLDNLPKDDNNINRITKYIFQTSETSLLPNNIYTNCIKKWKELNPSYKYFYFDSLDCAKFIKENFNSEIYTAYNMLIPGAYKADIWRCCVLYKYGGVYGDSQIIPLSNLDDILNDDYDIVTVKDNNIDHGIWQGFICSKPKNKILEKYIYAVDEILGYTYKSKYAPNNNKNSSLALTGPYKFGSYFNECIGKKSDSLLKLGKYTENGIVYKLLDFSSNIYTYDGKNIAFINKYNTYHNIDDIRQKQIITGKSHYSILWNSRNVYKFPLQIIHNILYSSKINSGITVNILTCNVNDNTTQKRLSYITEMLNIQEINYNIYNGVTKHSNKMKNINLGIISILKSIKNTHKYHLICEDDTCFVSNLQYEIDKSIYNLNKINKNWKIFHMCPGFIWGRNKHNQRIENNLENGILPIKIINDIYLGFPKKLNNEKITPGGPICILIKNDIIDCLINFMIDNQEQTADGNYYRFDDKYPGISYVASRPLCREKDQGKSIRLNEVSLNNLKFFNEPDKDGHYDGRYFRKQLPLKEKQNILRELFKVFVHFINQYNVKLCLAYGTLLGYYRNNDIIPWDDDIDVWIDKKDLFKNLPLKHTDDRYLWEININSVKYNKENTVAARFICKKTGVFIDVFSYYIKDKKFIDSENQQYNIDNILPFQRAIFLECYVYIPNNTEQTLIDYYKDIYYTNIRDELNKIKGGEGHSGDNPEETTFIRNIVKNKKTYCEIGFNKGHSSLSALEGDKNVIVNSFEYSRDKTRTSAENVLKTNFPGRLNLIWGDSTKTVPQTSNLSCDVFFIDGNHDYEYARDDLNNVRKHMKKDGKIIMDDVYCDAGYCEGPTKAWTEQINNGLITELSRHNKFAVGNLKNLDV